MHTMPASTPRLATPQPAANRWPRVLGVGLLAGLVAALAMTAVMALLRDLLGVPSVAELIGDRVIPLLTLKQFFELIDRFNGGSGIKRVGISSVIVGQLVVGTLAGLGFAAVVERGRRRAPERVWRLGVARRGWLYVAGLVAAAWLLSVGLLWPVLGTSYRGLPPGRAALATAVGLLLSYSVYGLALPLLYRLLTQRASLRQPAPLGEPVARRAVVVAGLGAGLALVAGDTLRRLYHRSTLQYDGTRYRGPVQPITPNDAFYAVTKNILDPEVERGLWRLELGGLVERPRSYSFAELTALPATQQEATLSCISNDVGDGLISNAVWTGVPLTALLDVAGVRPGVVDVAFQAVDNYIDTIPLEKALDGTVFVAWAMNGAQLPRRHGYPVRVVVPGRFGEKSVKWVTRVTLVGHHQKGFYARQGWGPTFVTQTLSRIDAPADGATLSLSAAPVTLQGIAFAGDRDVARVEVSADDGQTWQPARLDYHPSRIAWVLWSLAWTPPRPDDYRLSVRAIDGTGQTQTATRRGITPDGATGWHTVTVRVT
jgi:DMSO/TMAO reductase YedYZ molybdopterin-dependent catalytic subunit